MEQEATILTRNQFPRRDHDITGWRFDEIGALAHPLKILPHHRDHYAHIYLIPVTPQIL
jgi:hypothetical protein